MIPIKIHKFFTYGVFVVSMLTNLSFIGVSMTTINEQIGKYRYLMIGFAVTDIFVSLTHIVLMPGIQLSQVGYIFFGYHLVDMPSIYGLWADIFFVIFFYQTFIILAFHYIYRYAVVCKPRWRKLFPRYETLLWSLTALLVQLAWTYGYYKAVQIGFLPSNAKTAYYRHMLLNNTGVDCARVGYLAIMFRNPSQSGELQVNAVYGVMLGLVLSSLSIVIIASCSVLILRKLRHAGAVQLSQQAKTTQHQLLRALLVQTAIPTVFSYFPVAMIFVIPLLGLDLNGIYGDVMVMTTALFPAIDPIIMIYFVRSYRTRVIQIWREISCRRTNAVQQNQVQPSFTTKNEQ